MVFLTESYVLLFVLVPTFHFTLQFGQLSVKLLALLRQLRLVLGL